MEVIESKKEDYTAPEIVVGRDWEDYKIFGTKGTIYIGKHLVGTGEDAHLTTPVLLDVLRPHIITLTGKRGTGKSYSMGIFAEEILKLPEDIRENLCAVIIDTQGIFWTMKQPVEYSPYMREWNIEPKGFDVKVYVPEGQKEIFKEAGVVFDGTFSISPEQLSYSDWLFVFGIEMTDILGVLLQRVLSKRIFKTIEEIINEIKKIEGFEKEKLALENFFEATKHWGIFGEQKMPQLLLPGKVSIIDVSLTPQSIRALLVALISRMIIYERTIARRQEEYEKISGEKKYKIPMCWLMIDEAHNFIPNVGTTAATEPLMKIVKEGRQPGISLVLATQQPYKLHPDALSQCDLIISHRLTSKDDIEALKSIMQTYIIFDITKYMDELPRVKGVALILDDNSERLYKIRIRPRMSWHAGSSPVALKSRVL
ncbi:MAG: ATP-binding protein [Candidatus Aenigmatarchaeota archaeon]|nr:ATP-binding protein [Candidatus Aenigmarchaeota archaeon]